MHAQAAAAQGAAADALQRTRLERGATWDEETLNDNLNPHMPRRRSTSRGALTVLSVIMCGMLVGAQGQTVGAGRVLLESSKDGPDYVAQGIRDNAKKIENDVDGIKKAVDSVKLGMTNKQGPADEKPKLKASSPPPAPAAAHDKLQGLATSEEKVQQMKASVHAAAMIKQNAIQHQHAAKEAEGKQASANADDSGERGRQKKVITLHQPKWFAEGPYVIIGLLVTIFFTFCYCACSSQPTSMSNKYDMR